MRAGPRSWPRIAATRRTRRGRRHPRQDHHLVDARPGPGRGRPRPVVHHRRRRQRARHRRAVGRAASCFVVEADESDGTFVTLPRADVDRHQRRARPPRALGRLRRPARRRSPTSSPGPTGRASCAPTTRAPLALALGAPARVTYGTTPTPTTAWSTLATGRDGARSPWCAARRGRRELGTHRAAGRRAATTPATPPRPPWPRCGLGAPFEAARAALGRFGGVARRFERRGEAGGITFVDDYAHLPHRGAGRARRAAAAGGWGRVVCVFQPHRYSRTAALWPDLRRRLRRRRRPRRHRHLRRRARPPAPASPASCVVDAVLDARPAPPAGVPARPRRRW